MTQYDRVIVVKGQQWIQALQVKTMNKIFFVALCQCNVRHVVKGEMKYPEPLGKPAKQNTVNS